MKIIPFNEFTSIYYDLDKDEMVGCTKDELVKYFKGVFKNKERFESRWIHPRQKLFDQLKEMGKSQEKNYKKVVKLFDFIKENIDEAKEFTLEEGFKITDKFFQSLVFSSIDISEMFKKLGAKRIKTDGKETTLKTYDKEGNYTGDTTYTNIYENYEVDGEKLGMAGKKMYAVKCWCTSTNKEKWLWIDDQYKDDPLSAIASTFIIHKNLIPFIKCIKRQGDVLLIETTKDITPEGEKVSLSKEQYFGWLAAQS